MLIFEVFRNLIPPSEGVPGLRKNFNPFFRVLWLTKTLEKLVELFSGPISIFSQRLKKIFEIEPDFDTLSSKRGFKEGGGKNLWVLVIIRRS